MRIRMDIAYDGRKYQGWQMQSHTKQTIQGQIQKALYEVFQKDIVIHGSGRTDTGVHAEHQVAHFDITDTLSVHRLTSKEKPLNLIKALKFYLPSDIVIKKTSMVPKGFHARLSVLKKVYTYRIWNEIYLSPFMRYYVHHIPHKLDLDYLQKASELIIGKKDFKSFQNTGSHLQDTECLIFSTHWSLKACSMIEGSYIEFRIEGQRFLKQMVRNIIGTLLWMEYKKMDIQHLNEIIESKDRKQAYNTAPALGLYLTDVIYAQ